MQIFRIIGTLKNCITSDGENYRARKKREEEVNNFTTEFNDKLKNKNYLFLVDFYETKAEFGLISNEKIDIEKTVRKFAKGIKAELEEISFKEIRIRQLSNIMDISDSNNYIEKEYVMGLFGFHAVMAYGGMRFGEEMVNEMEKEVIIEKAGKMNMWNNFLPELDRIFAGKKNKKIEGHPVQYVLENDDHETRKNLYKTLLSALYKMGRIKNMRYAYTDFGENENKDLIDFENFYKSNIGGTVVIRDMLDGEEEQYARASRRELDNICECIKKYNNQVLTILCFPKESKKLKDEIYEKLDGISFVEISEDMMSREQVTDYLKELAKEKKVRCDKNLTSMFDEEKMYYLGEVAEKFEKWYSKKLRTSIYPQYEKVTAIEGTNRKKCGVGNDYRELMEMVGLKEAKRIINTSLDFFKVQKMYEDKGLKNDRPAMNMIFTGDPGTAKTTVARLFAGIMRDNKILSRGQLIEVGRSDLVGKFVGWTADIVKTKYKQASGGVLFIDEAYSLCDYKDGSFGDEAINTIVQEMENHRHDVVTIFAGYPDKMEKFLDKNPGLRSRIAFHIPFENYDSEQLCEIATLIAKKKGLALSNSACEKMHEIFEMVKDEKDFGNGRYVRNIIEKANMAHASRILSMDFDSMDRDDIITIEAEDIVVPNLLEKTKKIPMGFISAKSN